MNPNARQKKMLVVVGALIVFAALMLTGTVEIF